MTKQEEITSGDFKFNDPSGYVEVCGIKYSYELFKAWGEHGVAVGTHFELISRDECIMVKRYDDGN